MQNQSDLLDDKALLITGGTGTLGIALTRRLLTAHPGIKRLVIYSRDELKQFEMSEHFNGREYPCMRYFIGDVRDESRLRRALEGIDYVIHAAALKQVPAAEYNPFEYIKTNVLGAQNVIDTCLDRDVKRVVALSTDKAAAPINLYGATKLCSDKLFIAANNVKGARNIRFSVVRYGNIFGSRGSVVPLFLERKRTGVLPITDANMTRFTLTIEAGVDLVLWALANAIGGEIFVPKIPSYRIVDVAQAVGPECKRTIVGIRPGEKVHEEMITASDSVNTIDLGERYAILPASEGGLAEHYLRKAVGCSVPLGFCYNSGDNSNFLTVDQLRMLIREYLGRTTQTRISA